MARSSTGRFNVLSRARALLGDLARRFQGAEFYWLRRVIFFYPFTVVGTLLFLSSLYLLGKAFATQNPYAFMLSAVALVVLGVFAALGRAQASRFRSITVEWDTSSPLFAATSGLEHYLMLERMRSLPFYRIHFTLSGKLIVGRGSFMWPYQESSSRGGERVGIPLYFPLCGVFYARGRLSVKDAFGLSRARFGEVLERHITVRPSLLQERVFPTVEALDGLEDKSKLKQSDLERYFMREYIPGDRIRDINWKASSRFLELITRISPVTQEKTRVISVFFRPFRKRGGETATSIAHLNYIKSWLLLFLKTVKQAHPEYQFRILTGSESFQLETEEDIDQFSLDLSSVFYRPSLPEYGGELAAQVSGEAFVFSTPYDESLPAFLGGLSGSRVYMFRTVAPEAKRRDSTKKISLLTSASSALLAGPWIFARDRRLKNPNLPAEHRGLLLEEPLEVQLV
jgi:hypothetical protein